MYTFVEYENIPLEHEKKLKAIAAECWPKLLATGKIEEWANFFNRKFPDLLSEIRTPLLIEIAKNANLKGWKKAVIEKHLEECSGSEEAKRCFLDEIVSSDTMEDWMDELKSLEKMQ